jgi:hypothetical protein
MISSAGLLLRRDTLHLKNKFQKLLQSLYKIN